MNADFNKIKDVLDRSAAPIIAVDSARLAVWANRAALGLIEGAALPAPAEKLIGGSANILDRTGPLGPIEFTAGLLAGKRGFLAELGGGLLIFVQAGEKGLGGANRDIKTLSSAAHDLKNPIGAICGYADALIDTPIGDGLSEKQLSIIDKIRTAASRSIAMVRNYQFLGEMHKNTPPNGDARADLNRIAARAVEHLSKEHKLTPKVELNLARGPLFAKMDAQGLEKSVSCLVDNALSYTPPDGEIIVSSEEQPQEVRLIVANSPTFIPDAEKEIIFTRFGRGSAARGRIGAGLGLYIAKNVVEAAGGSLDFESSEGLGTRFTIRLPKCGTADTFSGD